ncbi:MAG: hypothetical protein IH808_10380 [Proteobacteria bacterium]|nr:hypothetical protein [Pseudomonadota bacterium]
MRYAVPASLWHRPKPFFALAVLLRSKDRGVPSVARPFTGQLHALRFPASLWHRPKPSMAWALDGAVIHWITANAPSHPLELRLIPTHPLDLRLVPLRPCTASTKYPAGHVTGGLW